MKKFIPFMILVAGILSAVSCRQADDLNENNLPENAVQGEKLTYRSITIENEELEFSGGFTDLHTQSYQRVLEGKGYGIEENRAAIETVEVIRVSPIVENPKKPHPLLAKVKKA
jgi:UDP-N-acetyl-2-amino-2-deoxyglucuronate dehydrogenase